MDYISPFVSRLDQLLWSKQQITNRLTQSNYISFNRLRIFRFIAFIFILQMVVTMLILSLQYTVLYLTHWAAYGTFLSYLLFTIGYLFPSLSQKPMFWKANHILFEFGFTAGSVVSFVFWTVIAPICLTMTKEQISSLIGKEVEVMDYIVNGEIHGAAYIFVFIDFYYNRIEFCWTHLPVLILIGLIYFAVLMTYTLVSGELVYPLVNFHNWFSIAFAIVPFLLAAATFSIGVCLTNRKKRMYSKAEGLVETSDPELPKALLIA